MARSHDSKVLVTSPATPICPISNTPITIVQLRDGEVVLYKRARSRRWQARYKLYDRKWRRISTGHINQEYAARVACEAYDEARFRERLGLPQTTRRFDVVARAVLDELRDDLGNGTGKRIYQDYIQVIKKYLIPYLGKRWINAIDAETLKGFEVWRNQIMGKTPRSSTMLTHASALSRIFDTAIRKGWLSDRHLVPRLNTRGTKSQARPAFTAAEITALLTFMPQWVMQSREGVAGEMRLLLRDYVEVLLYTGMRHGTESINLKWSHIDIYQSERQSQTYIRMWVSGKTGPRNLIAKNEIRATLDRLRSRFSGLSAGSLEDVLLQKHDLWVFRLPNGHRPPSLNGTFRRLMVASGLLKGASGSNRTLYSVRHTYATFSLMQGIGVHELARQMGTSVVMLERHYSKITPELVADKFAGRLLRMQYQPS